MVREQLDVIAIKFNDDFYYRNDDKMDGLRPVEKLQYELDEGGFYTFMVFDQKHYCVQGSLFSIYTTSFIIFLLLVSGLGGYDVWCMAYGFHYVIVHNV
ncbi:hypothetical protein EON63_08515 [archaeon]|nr:MAG: hypothetical protein EON63_08515 [archaeon]